MPQFIEKKCIECGKKFIADVRPHNKRCSRKCLYLSKSYKKLRSEIGKTFIGDKNPNWKGGVKRHHTGTDYNQRRMFQLLF